MSTLQTPVLPLARDESALRCTLFCFAAAMSLFVVLPRSCLLRVCAFLDLDTLVSVQALSRSWRALFTVPHPECVHFWRAKLESSIGSPTAVQRVWRRLDMPLVERLELCWRLIRRQELARRTAPAPDGNRWWHALGLLWRVIRADLLVGILYFGVTWVQVMAWRTILRQEAAYSHATAHQGQVRESRLMRHWNGLTNWGLRASFMPSIVVDWAGGTVGALSAFSRLFVRMPMFEYEARAALACFPANRPCTVYAHGAACHLTKWRYLSDAHYVALFVATVKLFCYGRWLEDDTVCLGARSTGVVAYAAQFDRWAVALVPRQATLDPSQRLSLMGTLPTCLSVLCSLMLTAAFACTWVSSGLRGRTHVGRLGRVHWRADPSLYLSIHGSSSATGTGVCVFSLRAPGFAPVCVDGALSVGSGPQWGRLGRLTAGCLPAPHLRVPADVVRTVPAR